MTKQSLKQKRDTKRRVVLGTMEAYMVDMRASGYTFRPTTDDWSPNFPDNLVGIKQIDWGPKKNGVVVCGADDTSMVYEAKDKKDAQRMFKSLPVIITFGDLVERGFRRD